MVNLEQKEKKVFGRVRLGGSDNLSIFRLVLVRGELISVKKTNNQNRSSFVYTLTIVGRTPFPAAPFHIAASRQRGSLLFL